MASKEQHVVSVSGYILPPLLLELQLNFGHILKDYTFKWKVSETHLSIWILNFILLDFDRADKVMITVLNDLISYRKLTEVVTLLNCLQTRSTLTTLQLLFACSVAADLWLVTLRFITCCQDCRRWMVIYLHMSHICWPMCLLPTDTTF